MCGINGIFGIENIDDPESLIRKMNAMMAHRGPNADGFYKGDNLILGHRRLSIIDISENGNQPFYSFDKRYIIVYNGELYNYRELKKELKNYPFKTETDTEVLLAAFIEWGTDFLNRLDGMFAFAIWDNQTKELLLARDRLGIKPLYLFRNNSSIYFSSEIRSLLVDPTIKRQLNHEGLIDFLRYQTVHAPNTILQGVEMVLPGYYVKISDNEVGSYQYWDISKSRNQGLNSISYEEITHEINKRLYRAVEKRLIADVPFGAFLSGGIDSSVIVALMNKVIPGKVKTFSIAFNEAKYDESKYAQIISKKFNTQHHEIRLEVNVFKDLLPEALNAMDHPSVDGINTFVVSKYTKDAGITMALSGLGGDEVFAGYDVFKRLHNIKSREWLQYFPKGIRKLGGGTLSLINPSVASDKLSEFLKLDYFHLENVYPLTRKVATEKRIKKLLSDYKNYISAVYKIANNQFGVGGGAANYPILSNISIAELTTYLPNVLLRDTDQMSMASALEVRVPFLDYKLIEYVLQVPDKFKYPSTPKKLLIDSMYGEIPDEVINRPKMGFVLPWENWMRKDLKPFCESHIYSLSKRDYFNEKEIIHLWNNFLKNDKRTTWSRVWYLIVLEDWMQKNNIA